jgi:hypothetical protein
MPKKQKESLSHLRCREAVGVDSIAPGMIHQMLYLSANAHPQYANVGEKSIVQHQNTGTPKPLANYTECDAAWENPNCQNGNRKENANAGPRSQLIRNNKTLTFDQQGVHIPT